MKVVKIGDEYYSNNTKAEIVDTYKLNVTLCEPSIKGSIDSGHIDDVIKILEDYHIRIVERNNSDLSLDCIKLVGNKIVEAFNIILNYNTKFLSSPNDTKFQEDYHLSQEDSIEFYHGDDGDIRALFGDAIATFSKNIKFK